MRQHGSPSTAVRVPLNTHTNDSPNPTTTQRRHNNNYTHTTTQVDLLYLHNVAETLLPRGASRADLAAALEAAFGELEALRAEGKLRGYGVATWDSLRVPPGADQYLALEDLVLLARRAGGAAHGFMAVQVPLNARADEALMRKWQPVAVARGSRLYPSPGAAGATAAGGGGGRRRLLWSAVPGSETAAAVADAAAAATAPAGAAGGGATAVGSAAAGAAAAGAAAGAAAPPPPPPPEDSTVTVHATLLDAARELGVLVFASAPLGEGELLPVATGALDAILALESMPSTAAKLLQLARSTPGIASTLVGQKTREHVEANARVARARQLSAEVHAVARAQVAAALRREAARRAAAGAAV